LNVASFQLNYYSYYVELVRAKSESDCYKSINSKSPVLYTIQSGLLLRIMVFSTKRWKQAAELTNKWKKTGFSKELLMKNTERIICPVCGGKTRDRIREDTELKNFPLFCPKCKQESIVDAKQLKITIIKEPDAKTQSR